MNGTIVADLEILSSFFSFVYGFLAMVNDELRPTSESFPIIDFS
jgi:hypothetical protein